MAYIQVLFQGAVKTEIPIKGQVTSIGRSPDNDIHVDNPGVSGRHAKVTMEEGNFFIEDNNSTNGTFVNGEKITRKALSHGDDITVFKHTLKFVEVSLRDDEGNSGEPAESAVGGSIAQDDMDSTVMIGASQMGGMLKNQQTNAAIKQGNASAKLVVMESSGQYTYTLASSRCVIGKQKNSDIPAKGWFAPAIAAVLHHTKNGYTITPHKRGKVKLNNNKITEPVRLQDGDQLRVRNLNMKFFLSLH